MTTNKYPKITIEFCARCKWHNRAIWYLQEIMQTFSDPSSNLIADISLQPNYNQPGLFQIILSRSETDDEVVYKRKFKKSEESQDEDWYFDGFPDSKFLKGLIRDKLWPDAKLGHIDKYTKGNFLVESHESKTNEDKPTNDDCTVCKIHE